MTIDDAIDHLRHIKKILPAPPGHINALALNLAIEALHRQQQIRKSGTPWFRGPLEGETFE